jgi:hypothetical protein
MKSQNQLNLVLSEVEDTGAGGKGGSRQIKELRKQLELFKNETLPTFKEEL